MMGSSDKVLYGYGYVWEGYVRLTIRAYVTEREKHTHTHDHEPMRERGRQVRVRVNGEKTRTHCFVNDCSRIIKICSLAQRGGRRRAAPERDGCT